MCQILYFFTDGMYTCKNIFTTIVENSSELNCGVFSALWAWSTKDFTTISKLTLLLLRTFFQGASFLLLLETYTMSSHGLQKATYIWLYETWGWSKRCHQWTIICQIQEKERSSVLSILYKVLCTFGNFNFPYSFIINCLSPFLMFYRRFILLWISFPLCL